MMDAFRLDGGYKKKITSDGSVAAETHKRGGGNRTSSFSFLVGVLQGRIQSSRFLLFFSPVFFNEIHAFRPLKKRGRFIGKYT